MSTNPFTNFTNLFGNKNEENKTKNQMLFGSTPLFPSNPDNKGASGTSFGLFTSNLNTNNP